MARGEEPFGSLDDLWRRSGLPADTLVRLAEADAFRPSLGLSRRDALWAIRGLRDEPLPLFSAAAEREAAAVPELAEPAVALRPMATGGEVVEDYGHVGLTLRAHPVSFLRESLARRRILTCAEAVRLKDRQKVETAGIVLVRQRPGSAKGVIFVTIEDETGIANLVVWRRIFLAHRPIVMGAPMIAIKGYVQREGEVVHIVAQHLAAVSEFAEIGRLGHASMPEEKAPGPVDAIRVRSRDFH